MLFDTQKQLCCQMGGSCLTSPKFCIEKKISGDVAVPAPFVVFFESAFGLLLGLDSLFDT